MVKPLKIGLIAGSGALPHEVIAGALAQNFEVFVAGIKGYVNISDFSVPTKMFSMGEIGGLIKTLKKQGCTHVSMAGNLDRPDFKTIKPDFRGMTLLPKVISAAAKGDDALLRFLLSVFEKEGFTILAPQDLCASSLIESGVMTDTAPTISHTSDIEKARDIAAIIGMHDIGQGCVVCNGLVLAVEAQEGTDEMLKRVILLSKDIRGIAENRQGVLAKRLKPNQEDRVDLPTIGVRTVELAAQAGLAGIVVEAGKAFVMQKQAVKSCADTHGIFILGYEIP